MKRDIIHVHVYKQDICSFHVQLKRIEVIFHVFNQFIIYGVTINFQYNMIRSCTCISIELYFHIKKKMWYDCQ